MRFVQSPFWIEIKLGESSLARSSTAQAKARILAVNEYPTIVGTIVMTVLQPVCASIYLFLDMSSIFVDPHQQSFAMNRICYRKVGTLSEACGARINSLASAGWGNSSFQYNLPCPSFTVDDNHCSLVEERGQNPTIWQFCC